MPRIAGSTAYNPEKTLNSFLYKHSILMSTTYFGQINVFF